MNKPAIGGTMSEEQVLPEWECFRDLAYYDMWCVRKVGERRFGFGYHVSSEAEARALCEEMTTLRAELARERELHQGLRQVVKEYRNQKTLIPHGGYCSPNPCTICITADALLEDKSKPVATTS